MLLVIREEIHLPEYFGLTRKFVFLWRTSLHQVARNRDVPERQGTIVVRSFYHILLVTRVLRCNFILKFFSVHLGLS